MKKDFSISSKKTEVFINLAGNSFEHKKNTHNGDSCHCVARLTIELLVDHAALSNCKKMFIVRMVYEAI